MNCAYWIALPFHKIKLTGAKKEQQQKNQKQRDNAYT